MIRIRTAGPSVVDPAVCRLRVTLVIAGVLSTGAAAHAQEEAGDFASALTGGEASIGIRYRYEHVDQDGFDENANASTARLRLNYKSAEWRGFSAFGEFDHVFHVLLTDFNSGAGTSPDRGQYPVVADPKGSDLNQLYLDYAARDDWKLRLGRQRILLDNQRFVGGVGWRQNEQTYDALTLTTQAIPKTELQYTYNTWVRRIFGQSVAAGRDRVRNHLINAKIALDDDWSLVPYLYYLDYQEDNRAASSTATLGARLAGSIGAGNGRIALVGEFARQSDAADNPIDYSANYLHLDGLWTLSNGLALGVGYESLGGDATSPGGAFRTPLATLHKFQGWADQFVVTPAAGVDDVYVTAKYRYGPWNLTGIYHNFSAESGGGDYGREFDVSLGRKFGGRYAVLLKAAIFSADAASSFSDTRKWWLQFSAAY